MGATGSKSLRLEKALGASFPDSEHYFGLANLDNTCYCNSVLQALYFCSPMRRHCLEYGASRASDGHIDDDLLSCLCDLYRSINSQKRRCGVYTPRRFVAKLRMENEIFNNQMHQDAHEFLNYLLNEMADILEKRQKQEAEAEEKRDPVELEESCGEKDGEVEKAKGKEKSKGRGRRPPRRNYSDAEEEGSSGSPNAGAKGAEKPADSKSRAKARDETAGLRQAGSRGGVQALRGSAAVGDGGAPAPCTGSGAGGALGGDTAEREAAAQAEAPAPRPQQRGKTTGKTWIHSLFEGGLTNETRCLSCESLTSRDESFLDLSLEIGQNSSVEECMRRFSALEAMRGDNKFYCDTCCSLQEAKKCLRLRSLPNVLALHLKRFKYVEAVGRFKKLSYRVDFPLTLTLASSTAKEGEGPPRTYHLFAIIVHMGSGPHHGHYVALVRSHEHWLCFDDETVELVDEQRLQEYFGSATDTNANTETGYILFYQAEVWDTAQGSESAAMGRGMGASDSPAGGGGDEDGVVGAEGESAAAAVATAAFVTADLD